MIYRVSDALPETSKYVGGAGVEYRCDPGRTQAVAALNRATRFLMDEGDWFGAGGNICITVNQCCFTLDGQFESIIAAAPRINGQPYRINHRNFKFVDSGPGAFDCCAPCISELEDQGDNFPTHHDLPKAMHIVVWSDRSEGSKPIEIRGIDSTGKEVLHRLPIRHHHGEDGKSPAFTPPDSEWWTDGKLKQIIELRKPETAGYVYVSGYDPETTELCWLTTIRPEVVSPCHRRYLIPGGSNDCQEIIAKVSFRYHPVYRDEDVLLIQNIEALSSMVQAQASKDKNDSGSYEFHKNSAISRLKKQKGKKNRGQRNRMQFRFGGSPLRGADYSTRKR